MELPVLVKHFCLAAFIVIGGPLAAKEEWPQWRGPEGQGHAVEAKDLPERWSETENVMWKTKLPGRGHSSPILTDDQIWLTCAEEVLADEATAKERLKANTGGQPVSVMAEVSLWAVCLDRESGGIKHRVELLRVPDPQWVHKLNSYASPTPVLADGRLYCHFGAFGTVCLDTVSAQVVWRNQELHVMHENGPGSTPVLVGGKLVCHLDGSDRQFVVALDAGTGQVAWKTDRTGELRENPQMRKSYGTPLVVTRGGRKEIISQGADWVYGYDPESGKERWKVAYGDLGFSNVAKPVAGGGRLFLATGFGKTELVAYSLEGPGAPQEIWRQKKAIPRMPSPILVGPNVYVVNDSGVLSCFDAATGEAHYQERIGGNFASSPLYADGKLYLGSQEGVTLVLAPGPVYQKLGESTLDGAIMASPAAVGRALYVRTEHALYRLEKKP